jgi:hypothetical protein
VLPWLAGIRAFEDEIAGDQFFTAWRDAMAGWGVDLVDGGELRRGGAEIGRWEPASETASLGESGCPFVGPRLGAIGFEVYDWGADANDRHELFCGLFKEGRDAVWHAPSQRRWSAVHLERRALADCVHKWSLDDGAELLTRVDADYAAATRAAFAAPLIEAGYWVHMSWPATSHNCLKLSAVQLADGRFVPAVLRDGEPVDDLDRVLGALSTELWLFDFGGLRRLLDDPELWP